MEEEVIKQKDIYQKDIFDNLSVSSKKSTEQLNVQLTAIDAMAVGLGKLLTKQENILKNSSKGVIDGSKIKKGNEALKNTNVILEDLEKTNKQRLIIRDKLDKSLNKEAKSLSDLQASLDQLKRERISLNKAEKNGSVTAKEANQRRSELNVLIKSSSKELLNEQKEILKSTDAYTVLTTKTNKAQKTFKKLAATFGVNSKQAKKAKKEFNKLDKELREINEDAKDGKRDVGRYGAALSDASKDLLKYAAAGAVAAASVQGVSSSVQASEEGSEDLRKVTAAAEGGLRVFKNTAAATVLDLFDFGKALISGEKELNQIGESFNRTSKATEDYQEKLQNSIDAEIEAENSAIALEKARRPLEIQISKITEQLEIQNAIAGDSTRSFDEIAAATNKASSLDLQRLKLLQEISSEELRILNNRIQSRKRIGANVQDLLDDQLSAELTLLEAKKEFSLAEIDLNKTRQENSRDRFERELDFAIDAFDSVKTVNEKRITDERISLIDRSKIFKDTENLTNSSFQSQIKLVKDFTKTKIDLDALSLESDERIIRSKLENFNFDDVTLGRVLEIIRERKIAIQDLADVEKDLQDARLESQQNIDESLFNITQDNLDLEIEQNKDSIDKILKLKEDSINNQAEFDKQQAKENIKEKEELNAKLLEIEEKQSNDIIRLKQEQTDKTNKIELAAAKKKEEELLEFKKTVANESINLTKQEIQKRNDEINKGLDKEISDRENALSIQQQRAENGLENSLQFEKQKLAEAELAKKEQQEKEQKQAEVQLLAESFLKAYIAELGKPNADPLLAGGKALASTLIAKGIAGTIAGSAYDGVEDTGSGKGQDNKNGMLWMLHPNERVISKEHNTKMGGISNDEASQIVYNYNHGLIDTNQLNAKEKQVIVDNSQVTMAIRSLENTIKNQPIQHVSVDRLGGLIETVYKNGAKTIINHERSRF